MVSCIFFTFLLEDVFDSYNQEIWHLVLLWLINYRKLQLATYISYCFYYNHQQMHK